MDIAIRWFYLARALHFTPLPSPSQDGEMLISQTRDFTEVTFTSRRKRKVQLLSSTSRANVVIRFGFVLTLWDMARQ